LQGIIIHRQKLPAQTRTFDRCDTRPFSWSVRHPRRSKRLRAQ